MCEVNVIVTDISNMNCGRLASVSKLQMAVHKTSFEGLHGNRTRDRTQIENHTTRPGSLDIARPSNQN